MDLYHPYQKKVLPGTSGMHITTTRSVYCLDVCIRFDDVTIVIHEKRRWTADVA